MLALTQCWYTRKHVPARGLHREEDGSWSGHCRHCERDIVSWDKRRWFPADGFNVTHLAETTGTRYLYLYDQADDMVVARFPVGHLANEASIADYAEQLRAEHGVDQPGSDLVLLDSAHGA